MVKNSFQRAKGALGNNPNRIDFNKGGTELASCLMTTKTRGLVASQNRVGPKVSSRCQFFIGWALILFIGVGVLCGVSHLWS